MKDLPFMLCSLILIASILMAFVGAIYERPIFAVCNVLVAIIFIFILAYDNRGTR